jgi:NitT/TauT family transport system ATP-binding protein
MYLQISQLHKHFDTRHGRVTVLKDINMTIQAGEFITVVGASGSGKSTLLRQIAGLDRPTTGEVRIDGQVISSPGPDRGMVFQHYTLYPWMSISDNVAFGLKLQGVGPRERQEQASYYLNVVGLTDFAKSLPRQLSGGMKQRVAIARALASNPKVLLMDEPFSALDVHTREAMHEFLRELWQSLGLTVMMITHDVDEALMLSQRIYALSSRPGTVKQELVVDLPERQGRIKGSEVFQNYRAELIALLRDEDGPRLLPMAV